MYTNNIGLKCTKWIVLPKGLLSTQPQLELIYTPNFQVLITWKKKKKRKKKAEKKQGFTQAKFEFAFSTQLPLISDSGINVEEKKRQMLRWQDFVTLTKMLS